MSEKSTSKEEIRSLSWREIGQLLKDTTVEYFGESTMMHSASLAYFTLFAMIPLLYLSTNVFGRVVGNDTVQGVVADLLQNQVGIQDISGILSFLSTVDLAKGNLFLEVVGAFALLFSCSAFLFALKRSLNDFFDLNVQEVKRKKLFISNLLFRLSSILIIGVLGILVIGFYMGQTILMSTSKDFLGDSGISRFLQMLIDNGGAIAMNVAIFTLIFKYVHDGKVPWKYAIGGALVTSVLLYGGQLLIKYYLGHYFFASRGGITGTFFILLAWVYYSAQIIFFGAKFITVYARTVGKPIRIKFRTKKEQENRLL